jgi:hypothetical protein
MSNEMAPGRTGNFAAGPGGFMTNTTVPRPEEQRLVLRLLNYWRELANERSMPTVADIADSSADIRQHCFILEFADAGELVFQFVGEGQHAALGSDPTGLPLSVIDDETLLGRAVSYRAQVIERQAPVSVGGQFTDKDGRAVLYRSILLPLGENAITALLGCVNSRVVVLE